MGGTGKGVCVWGGGGGFLGRERVRRKVNVWYASYKFPIHSARGRNMYRSLKVSIP